MSDKAPLLGLACDATVTMEINANGPGGRMKGATCEYPARYYRDGHPVCSLHSHTRTVEWGQRVAYSVKDAWSK